MQAGAWGVSVSIDYADGRAHDRRARHGRGLASRPGGPSRLLSAARVYKFQRRQRHAVLHGRQHRRAGEAHHHGRRARRLLHGPALRQRKTGSHTFAHNDGPGSPRLLDLADAWPNFLSNPYYLARFDQFLHGGIPGCRAGRAFFNIDSTGDVAICVERKGQPDRQPLPRPAAAPSTSACAKPAATTPAQRLLVQLPRRSRKPLLRRGPLEIPPHLHLRQGKSAGWQIENVPHSQIPFICPLHHPKRRGKMTPTTSAQARSSEAQSTPA